MRLKGRAWPPVTGLARDSGDGGRSGSPALRGGLRPSRKVAEPEGGFRGRVNGLGSRSGTAAAPSEQSVSRLPRLMLPTASWRRPPATRG